MKQKSLGNVKNSGSSYLGVTLLLCILWIISLPGGEVVAAIVDTVTWGPEKIEF